VFAKALSAASEAKKQAEREKTRRAFDAEQEKTKRMISLIVIAAFVIEVPIAIIALRNNWISWEYPSAVLAIVDGPLGLVLASISVSYFK
jgi:hypothetical protein